MNPRRSSLRNVSRRHEVAASTYPRWGKGLSRNEAAWSKLGMPVTTSFSAGAPFRANRSR